jgi:hypothetical protein
MAFYVWNRTGDPLVSVAMAPLAYQSLTSWVRG